MGVGGAGRKCAERGNRVRGRLREGKSAYVNSRVTENSKLFRAAEIRKAQWLIMQLTTNHALDNV